jgi:hypothetical protein
MRTAALVLGCVGGALFIVAGVPLTVAHPYGLLFLLAGVLGIVGALKTRTRRAPALINLGIATVLALLPSIIGVAAGVGPAVTFLFLVPTLCLLLATIFTFAAP